MRLNFLSSRNPGFTISHFLSGQHPVFRRISNGYPVSIRVPLFILGPTNIRLNPGFKVIGRVNCYLVNIQASQYTLLLSGQHPGFTMSCIAIWSMSGLHDTLLLIWSTSRFQKNLQGILLFSGRSSGFSIVRIKSGRIQASLSGTGICPLI